MISALQRPLRGLLLRVEGVADFVFGTRLNPFYHLGALAWFSFWVVCVTGILIYVFFETSVSAAWHSVEYMTRDQWYFAGIMRSLHRYASDLMVLLAMLHLLREFAMDRYHGVRWFAWFTGIPTVWLLFFSGVSGYWLVWDMLGQYVAVGSTEWLDAIGIFSEPIANNFLLPESLSDRFFSLLVYIHIFVPVALLLLMWIHLLRLAGAETNPPRELAIGTLAAMVILSLIVPATSHDPADLTRTPGALNLDWFYLGLFPLFDRWGPAILWALTVGASAALSLLPVVHRVKKKPTAQVDLANCNGCTRCALDCPFGAITMQPRTDGRPFEKQPVVNESYCSSCGICFGACPTTTPFRTKGDVTAGISLPFQDLRESREMVTEAAATLSGPVKILIFGCFHGAPMDSLRSAEVAPVTLTCTGALSPTFVDFAFSRCGVDGIVVTGCRDGECFYRLGVKWTEERLYGYRDPVLRERVQRDRIMIAWAAPTDLPRLRASVESFRSDIAAEKAAAAAPQHNMVASGGVE